MLPVSLKDRLSLGKTLKVSPICLGITKPEMVETAFELGVNFFFLTADMHWPLYEGLREGLRRLFANGVRRDEVVIACTSYVTQPEFTWVPFLEASWEVEGMTGPDVIISGGSYESDVLEGGRIKAFGHRVSNPEIYKSNPFASPRLAASGASFHSRIASIDAINDDILDIAFVRYNASHYGAKTDLFPLLKVDRKSLVYSFKSMDGYTPHPFIDSLGDDELWKPSKSDQYRLVMSEPKLDGILCAVHTRDELLALELALSLPPFEEDDVEHMLELSRLYAESLRSMP